MSYSFSFHYSLNSQIFDTAYKVIFDSFFEKKATSCVYVQDEASKHALDKILWTKGRGSFLPHAIDTDSDLEHNPIIITTLDNFGKTFTQLQENIFINTLYQQSCDFIDSSIIFDKDISSIDDVRKYYSYLKSLGHKLSYLQH